MINTIWLEMNSGCHDLGVGKILNSIVWNSQLSLLQRFTLMMHGILDFHDFDGNPETI